MSGRAGMMRIAIGSLVAAALLAAPLHAQEQAPPDCLAIAAERARVEAEHRALKEEIADIAMGRSPRKRKAPSGGKVARGAASAAAGLLLPFPLGLALGVGRAAAKRGGDGKRAPDPGPDVAGMIEQRQQLEARLVELAASGC